MGYFVRTMEHQWGHDEDSLFKAMVNAGLRQLTLSECQADALEEHLAYEEGSALQALKQGERSWRSQRNDSDYSDDVHFQVIYADDDWRFVGADPVNGSPSYEWIGDGEMPKRVPTRKLDLVFNRVSGEITRPE